MNSEELQDSSIQPTHVLKCEYEDGVKLIQPLSWCGRELKYPQWYFSGAQQAALSVGGSVQPCKNCIKAIIKELSKQLD